MSRKSSHPRRTPRPVRPRGVDRVRAVGILVCGVILLVLGIPMMVGFLAEGNAVLAGEAVKGSFTAVSERCPRLAGDCYAIGTFTSDDGRSVEGVEFLHAGWLEIGESTSAQILELDQMSRVYPDGWRRVIPAWAQLSLLVVGGLVVTGFGLLDVTGRDPFGSALWRSWFGLRKAGPD